MDDLCRRCRIAPLRGNYYLGICSECLKQGRAGIRYSTGQVGVAGSAGTRPLTAEVLGGVVPMLGTGEPTRVAS